MPHTLTFMSFGKEIKVVRRALAMADGQAVSNGFREVRLRRLHGLGQGFTPCQLRRNRRRKGAAGAVRVRGIDEFTFEEVKELSIVQDVRCSLGHEMPALDQYILAPQFMNHFCRLAR